MQLVMRTTCERKPGHARPHAGYVSSPDPFDLRDFRARDDPLVLIRAVVAHCRDDDPIPVVGCL
jgi:hypothetical protein